MIHRNRRMSGKAIFLLLLQRNLRTHLRGVTLLHLHRLLRRDRAIAGSKGAAQWSSILNPLQGLKVSTCALREVTRNKFGGT